MAERHLIKSGVLSTSSCPGRQTSNNCDHFECSSVFVKWSFWKVSWQKVMSKCGSSGRRLRAKLLRKSIKRSYTMRLLLKGIPAFQYPSSIWWQYKNRSCDCGIDSRLHDNTYRILCRTRSSVLTSWANAFIRLQTFNMSLARCMQGDSWSARNQPANEGNENPMLYAIGWTVWVGSPHSSPWQQCCYLPISSSSSVSMFSNRVIILVP